MNILLDVETQLKCFPRAGLKSASLQLPSSALWSSQSQDSSSEHHTYRGILTNWSRSATASVLESHLHCFITRIVFCTLLWLFWQLRCPKILLYSTQTHRSLLLNLHQVEFSPACSYGIDFFWKPQSKTSHLFLLSFDSLLSAHHSSLKGILDPDSAVPHISQPFCICVTHLFIFFNIYFYLLV